MVPLTLLAAQKLQTKLSGGSALPQEIAALASASNLALPTITPGQVVLSSANPELSDKNLESSYPRVCIYSTGRKNTQLEKFRSFSGEIGLVAEIWASADLITQTDEFVHYYVEGVSTILQASVGDWGDGMFYSGRYDVQLQAPKAGGLGFVRSAKLTFNLNATLS